MIKVYITRWSRRHSIGIRGAALCLFGVLALSRAVSAAVPDEARQGAQLFKDSSYKEAADAFRQATIASPDDVRWRYDLGLSEALGKDFENALNHLNTTATQASKQVAGASYYNAGNVEMAMGKFAEAAGAYRQALLRNPADQDAKHNLELALKQLQEQQKKQGNSPKDSTQNQKDQNKDKKEQKQDQKQDQKNQDKKQDQNKDKSQDKQKPDSTGQQPQPDSTQQQMSDSTLSREQAERILRALADEEARLRDQVKKGMLLPAPGGKDW